MNMKTKKDNLALKKALDVRMGGGLPSNFNYRMMDRIRLEAERQKKRRRFVSWLSLALASLLLIAFGGYVLVDYMDFDVMRYLPHIERIQLSSDLFGFYGYIAVLISILLGFDYWMRRRKRKMFEE